MCVDAVKWNAKFGYCYYEEIAMLSFLKVKGNVYKCKNWINRSIYKLVNNIKDLKINKKYYIDF